MMQCRQQRGASLIEMVVSIVIISISMTAVMMVITEVARNSADPMVRTQATAIAQAYMDEILTQPLNDPDGGETGAAEAGETRATFDDVSDYHGLNDNTGARDQTDTPVAGLEAYNISVAVTATTLGGFPAKRIVVDVGFDGDVDFSLPVAAVRMN